jgi:hypothetical protein
LAILYDNPPSVKPKTTDQRSLTRLYASSIKEKVRVATSTPAPKAMIEAIMLFLMVTYEVRTAPANKGILATKPHRRDSKIVPLVNDTSYISTFYF